MQHLSEMRPPALERGKTNREANVEKRAKYIIQLGSPETIRAAHVAVRRSPTVYEESLFLRQNDYWIIRYHGQAAFFKSTRGLCCLAVLQGSFPLFCVGAVFSGFYAAAHQSYRFAAADTASEAFRPKAIS